jgi:prepilin-type N-terminal cleavage/methylation domain-containing protein
MARTSATKMARRLRASSSGYTLVEMLVVVTILALVASGVIPSLLSMRTSSQRRSTISAVRRMAATARERAIERGATTQIVYDESTKKLNIEDLDDQGTATTAVTIPLLAGVEPQKFELQAKESNASDFKLTFTPDGRSVGGGIEFQDFSILVDTNGAERYQTGALPDPTDRQWQAGDLEQRTQ